MSNLHHVAVCVPATNYPAPGTPYTVYSDRLSASVLVNCVMEDGSVGRLKLTKAYLSEQPSPFEMTAEDGAVASGLIVSCWITAFAVRSVIAIFRGSVKDD